MMSLYSQVCQECSQLITNRYSTSFSMGIRMFDKKLRAPIYAIYGFVRFADEIVDTFHQYDKKTLLHEFRTHTFKAIQDKISLNPVLHSFQEVVNEYHIDQELIEAFLESMEMDLHFDRYEDALYKQYIYGSAEVIGLMCLKIFCHQEPNRYEQLKESAKSLGSAFQKINFLRDMKADYDERGRVYFPAIDFKKFTTTEKLEIEADIQNDFDKGYEGIIQLPKEAKLGVYLAYIYYSNLFDKIKNSSVAKVKEERIRVHDGKKMYLLFRATLKNQLNLLN